MSPEQYGSYAVAFAIFLFLHFPPGLAAGTHAGVRRFGVSQLSSWLPEGAAPASCRHELGDVRGTVLCRGRHAEVWASRSALPSALVGVAFAAPSILLFWMVKRTFYLKLSPAPSAGAAVLYCILTMGGLAFVYKHGHSFRLFPLYC